MRAAVLGLLLVGCSDHSPPSSSTPDANEVDAPFVDSRVCNSPAGTAAITAAHQDLQPHYGRTYLGGVFAGGGDSGNPTLSFSLSAFFTNETLPTATDVINCEGSSVMTSTCPTVGLVVESSFERGDAIGDHDAQIRNTAATWQATGTLSLTAVVYPDDTSDGHLVGTLHVDQADPQVTIDGSFDHTFCQGLVEWVL